ncbi:Gfo/Idh/MocA family protein [Streptomyces liangshanensis]|uniref:Gfo/Idh/MocA family protein n=1 Tax=Streptomyces liangshanensis TaxID=2717324 RepID=UPI0036DE56DB
MSKPPRIGLLGAGPWAERTQAPALAAHPGVEFSGVWGRRPEAAAALAAAHDTTAHSGEAGIDALFAESDAIAFALPPDVQAPLAVRAAAAGCHLIMDKPVATTVEGARAVADAAAAANVASVVFCTLRFSPVTSAWIDDQVATGGWFTAHAQWLGSLYGPSAESSPFAASPWRREKGGLWDVGPHALSALIPLLGDVTEVTAVRGEPDLTHLVLRHNSGATSTAALSLSAPSQGARTGFVAHGEHGVVALPEEWGDPIGSFTAAVDALLASVRSGLPHACDVRFGLRLTEILAEAEKQVAAVAAPTGK